MNAEGAKLGGEVSTELNVAIQREYGNPKGGAKPHKVN